MNLVAAFSNRSGTFDVVKLANKILVVVVRDLPSLFSIVRMMPLASCSLVILFVFAQAGVVTKKASKQMYVLNVFIKHLGLEENIGSIGKKNQKEDECAPEAGDRIG